MTHTRLVQRDSSVFVTLRFIENRITETGSHQKKYDPSPSLLSSHWPHKSRYSRHMYAKFRVIQTMFICSSTALKLNRVNDTRVISALYVT